MKAHLAILIVLVIILTFVVLDFGRSTAGCGPGCRCPRCYYGMKGSRAGMTGGAPAGAAGATAVRRPPARGRGGPPAYPMAGYGAGGAGKAEAAPDARAAAEYEAWTQAGLGTDSFSPERSVDAGDDVGAHHGDPNLLDYEAYVRGQVIDPKMVATHADWVNELGPYSAVARKIGAEDFDAYKYGGGQIWGLKAFSSTYAENSPSIKNPSQVMHVDSDDMEYGGRSPSADVFQFLS